MSSIDKIASARANGAKSRGPVTASGKLAAAANSAASTGPVTPEGKAICSKNATRHGLLATSICFHGESEDRFSALLARLEEELQPETGVESDQVEIMAIAHWRRMRLWSIEKVLLHDETMKRWDTLETSEGGEGNKNDANDANDRNSQHEAPIVDFARSFRSMSDESRVLELRHRYEISFSREYTRALACLKSHRADRNAAKTRTRATPKTTPQKTSNFETE